MLISHTHRFIYMKTFKTGGTSVEIYFERYCLDPNRVFEERHAREAEVSKWGIVGARGDPSDVERIWRNHMPAGRVLAQVGPEIWRRYYKFCVVRNPFDKMVSAFWHNVPPARRAEFQQAPFEAVRDRFQEWLETAEHPMDRNAFTIGGRPVMDRFVRYENLHAGLEGVCQDLSLPWDPSRLGRYKSRARVRNDPFVQYYTKQSVLRVRELYQWELEHFQYPEPT